MVSRLILSRCNISAEVHIGGGYVFRALVVAAVIVVLDEASDVGFEISGQAVVFEQRFLFASSEDLFSPAPVGVWGKLIPAEPEQPGPRSHLKAAEATDVAEALAPSGLKFRRFSSGAAIGAFGWCRV